MFEIKNKILLITGGAIGIGASVHVTILDIDEKNGFAIEKELTTQYGSNKVNFIKCDVTHEQELINAFNAVKSEQGYIDIVINNAGIATEKDFVKAFEVNVIALIRSTLQAWDLMREDKGGRGGTVINIASIAGLGHFPFMSIYSATKAAVVKFGTSVGDTLHYSTSGVRVLTVCYGVTDTQMPKGKISSFNENVEDFISSSLRAFPWQTADEAAIGLSEVYKQGTSGTVWIVANGKPAVDVTERFMETTKAFDDILLS